MILVFRDQLSDIVAEACLVDAADVIVDLSGIQHMSAAALRVLDQTGDWLRRRSRLLTFRSPSRIARRLLDVCQLTPTAED